MLFTEDTIFSSLSILSSLVKYQLTIYSWAHLWAFNSVPLVHVYIFMLVPYCFDYYSFVVMFEIRKCGTSSLSIVRIVLEIQGLLWFHTNPKIALSISANSVIGILIKVALNLLRALSNMDILTILILSISEYETSFHFFVSSSISFIKVLKYSLYRYFTSFVKFTPNFIAFAAIVNVFVFRFYSFSRLFIVSLQQ